MQKSQGAYDIGNKCTNLNNNNNNNNNQFICGVVEGFYGKPWTFSQRKDLFKRLKEFNMNAFMYAPKDDIKHRAKWRQLYNDAEAEELKSLINEAASNEVDFYYSLAPGLDMVYSSTEETNLLCQKFKQLKDLGCKSYAILFDDIEPNLTNEKDRLMFHDNYAAAQVSITNMIYNFLDKPKFLFCPTEYCESRAVPDVTNSNYLNTIGVGLHNAIDIMWSGPRVVSRFITEESIQQLNSVLRRPAVIWENLHANDYDKKRVYLGPYSGRSTKIIPQLRGVLTNPNCEYEANYVAIHTLAQWSRCTKDINPHNRCNQERRLSNELERVTDDSSSDLTYDPDRALVQAIRDWLPHILSNRSLPEDYDMSNVDSRADEDAICELSKEEPRAPNMQVEDNSNDNVDVEEEMPVEKSPTDSTLSKSDMDTSCSPLNKNMDTNSCDSCEMHESDPQPHERIGIGCISCSDQTSLPSKVGERDQIHSISIQKVDMDSVSLLVDFFYLPFEHGLRGHAFLRDIKWLIDNSGIFAPVGSEDEGGDHVGVETSRDADDAKMRDVDERSNTPIARSDSKLVEQWAERAEKLTHFCACIKRIIDTLLHDCPNKLIMVELYPYLTELHDVVVMISDYIKYLRNRKSISDRFYFSGGPKRREYASSDEYEPWVHRGGLIGDVQRLIN